MFGKESLLPPRTVMALIVGITVVPLATLLWLGWRLLEQDRMLEGQQAQQRVERAADLVVAALQRALSLSARRLAEGSLQWPEGAVILTFRDGRAEAHPAGRIAHLPVIQPLREAPAATFAQGEDQEFRNRDPAAAIPVFRGLARSSDPAVRAGALLRLARNLRNTGHRQEALATYAQLSAMDAVSVGGAPAGLVARYARCRLLQEEKRWPELRAEAQRLHSDLLAGHWVLTAPLYWLYSADAARWAEPGALRSGFGAGSAPLRRAELFAEAADVLWQKRRAMPSSGPFSGPSSGQESLVIEGETLAVLWQSSPPSVPSSGGGSFRALLAARGFIESQWLPAIVRLAKEQRISWALRDSGGRVVFGRAGNPELSLRVSAGAAKATRSARDADLPWSIVAASDDPLGRQADFVLRRRLLVSGLVLLVFMALTAGYLIVRSVSRELAVARLQSDFVAAVSHEFRTPLTALRQFTDMLRERNLDDDRRAVCYEAQSRATDRLTRLVESLLDFGRMEAGARPYRFEPRDCSELVGRVVEEFRSDARAAGYAVALHGNGSARIEADGEALSRAVWNLLDNAVKYSPGRRTVEVSLNKSEGNILIAVRDQGIGIPAQERAAIFARFHRGEQARTLGIKGTGIGLAMVDQIVRAHQGRVEVESEPGKGSTFTIVLPAKV